MPGLKIIEIVLGLTFVYLLLSLLATAINEYISGMLNKRGRELFKAVDDLLGSKEVQDAFYKHPLITTLSPSHDKIRTRAKEIETRLWGTRWVRRLSNWMRPTIRCQRLPSYLPARNFALALLNSTDYADGLRTTASPPAAPRTGLAGSATSPPADVAETPGHLVRLFDALLQESAADVSELLRDPSVAAILGSSAVPPSVRDAVTNVTTGAEREIQKLQDSVEVWFNNAMDRVSGAYKRYTQIALLLIGLVIAILLNVDTIQIWQTLSTDEQARNALVQRAIAFDAAARDTVKKDSTAADTTDRVPAGTTNGTPTDGTTTDGATVDGTTTDGSATDASATHTPATDGSAAPADTTCSLVTGAAAQKAVAKVLADERLTCGEARTVMVIARAQLDSTQLAVGWTEADLLKLGVAKVDTVKPDTTKPDTTKARQAAARSAASTRGAATPAVETKLSPVLWPGDWHWKALLPKLLGLVLTAIAVSLGAPFWFDVLNKIINIRSAGRAPDERPKNPEARDKRMAGVAPR